MKSAAPFPGSSRALCLNRAATLEHDIARLCRAMSLGLRQSMRATGPIAMALALALGACAASDPVPPPAPAVTGSTGARSLIATAGVLGNGLGTGLDERDRQLAFCSRDARARHRRAGRAGRLARPSGALRHRGAGRAITRPAARAAATIPTRSTSTESRRPRAPPPAAMRTGAGRRPAERHAGAFFLNGFLTPGR